MSSESSADEETQTVNTVRTVDESETVHPVCSYCQQPLEPDVGEQWRGEPVHLECGAALRCGISLGEQTE